MKRIIWITSIITMFFLLVAFSENHVYAAGPVHLRFASHVIGGTGYTQIALVAQQLRPHLPKGSTIDVLPYSGGIGNVILIEDGKAELGIGNTTSDRWAVDGKVIFNKKYTKLRHVGTTDVFYICVYATERSRIKSLEEAFNAKKPIRWLALEKGSIGEATTHLLLEAYGASGEKLKAWGGSFVNTGWVNVASTLGDGRADIVSHGVGAGHPSMTETALMVAGHFLDIKESVRDHLAKEFGFDKSELPANTFKNQTKPVKTIGYYFTIIASADLSEEVVYLLTKVLAEERQELIRGHKSFATVVPEASCQPGKFGAPFHPGAERYYREKGWMK